MNARGPHGRCDVVLAAPARPGAATGWLSDLRYAASYLRRRGLRVEWLGPVDPVAAADGVSALRPALLYLPLGEEDHAAARQVVAAVRRAAPAVRVAVGGTAADARALLAWPGVDGVVRGECEPALADAAERLRAGTTLEGTPGLASRTTDGGPPRLLADLDDLPPMATDGLADLLAPVEPAARVGHVTTSRGCYARCSFCAVPLRSRAPGLPPWRGRSPSRVVDELAALRDSLGVRHFTFTDDNFLGPGRRGHERAIRLATELVERALDVELYLACRVADVREPTVAALVRAGLRKLALSVESTSPRALDLFEKQLEPSAIPRALDLLERLGVATEVNLIFFDPYASLADVRANLALLERLARSRHLSYARSFALSELRVPPWAPIRARIEPDLLEADGWRCRYRDAAVQALVEAVRPMADHPALDFKDPLLFVSLRERAPALARAGQLEPLLRFAAACRNTLNLRVLPELLRAGCDAVERAGPRALEVAGLAARFDAAARRMEAAARDAARA